MDKVPINIDEFGNTSGVSIPLLIVTNKKDFEINSSRNFTFVVYGSVHTWCICSMQMDTSVKIFDLIEI